ncbi:MAG TPA: carbon-nitrogen hydrolase family protein [Methanobacteriaceae archaeon]|nr:carbon-nitrogen hydrolase family protein [Methanobacteriaceae archaeon]
MIIHAGKGTRVYAGKGTRVEGYKKSGDIQKADLVILPEMFNCPYQTDKFPEYAEEQKNSPTLKAISRAAKEVGVYIVAGSIPERDENHVYNTSFIFNSAGELIGRHRKMHLFDVDVVGQIQFKESETLTAGDTITVIDTDFAKIGVAICYDIRFPELSRLMALEGAQLLIFPGAFNLTTGPAHWKAISRVRAVDNQVYVASCSPARDESAPYVAYGHSMVADPWGDVISEASTGEEIIYAEVDLSQLEKVRQEFPLLKNSRQDIYSVQYKKGK